MNIEILRNTLYKAYLDDFARFCTGLGGATAEIMGDLLSFEVIAACSPCAPFISTQCQLHYLIVHQMPDHGAISCSTPAAVTIDVAAHCQVRGSGLSEPEYRPVLCSATALDDTKSLESDLAPVLRLTGGRSTSP